jgi:hypothetical protein
MGIRLEICREAVFSITALELIESVNKSPKRSGIRS